MTVTTKINLGDHDSVHDTLRRQRILNAIYEQLQEGESLEEVLDVIGADVLDLMGTERFTVYERTADGREICSRFKNGDEFQEIRVPLSPSSVAGYVAMSQESVMIDDVYDEEQLTSIHSRLRFDYSFDQESGFLTRSMLVVPVCAGDTMLGVLQLINKRDEQPFADQDLDLAMQLASVLAQKLCFDRATTQGPYEYLIQEERITAEQLAEVQEMSEEQGLSVAYLLRREFELSDDEIGLSLEQYYQVPFMAYDPDVVLPEILDTLNKQFLVRSTWCPVAGGSQRVVILIYNPNDAGRIMDIQRILLADSYEFMVGIKEDILQYLGIEPPDEEEVVKDIEAPLATMDELIVRLGEEAEGGAGDELGEGVELVDENAATVVQLVSKLIADGVEMGASDIHIEPSKGKAPGIVRMRVDGVCRPVLEIPSHYVRYVVARIKIMSKVDIAETRLPQDGKIACRLKGEPLELRVATVPTVNGESVVMRILAAGEPMTFDMLNLMPQNAEFVNTMLEHPYGIVLVVGPTGSGKTTTLHALLAVINTPERKILTAEDPIEITQPGLQQVQVRHQIGLDFARVLRSFLRADPDVILIGEMRDFETASSGIEASLTGHLVFSTLHTNSAPETITRLLDMGLDPLNFSDALIGVLAQRLCRTLCKACKEAYPPDGEEMERLINSYGAEYFPELGINEAEVEIYRPVGCEICGNTGYKGRTGLHEVLLASREIKEMVAKKAAAGEVREMGMSQGMRTLMQDGVAKIFQGICDLKQVRAVALS